MNPVASLPSAGVAESIRLQLQQSGSAHAAIDQLPVTVNEWRRMHARSRVSWDVP